MPPPPRCSDGRNTRGHTYLSRRKEAGRYGPGSETGTPHRRSAVPGLPRAHDPRRTRNAPLTVKHTCPTHRRRPQKEKNPSDDHLVRPPTGCSHNRRRPDPRRHRPGHPDPGAARLGRGRQPRPPLTPRSPRTNPCGPTHRHSRRRITGAPSPAPPTHVDGTPGVNDWLPDQLRLRRRVHRDHPRPRQDNRSGQDTGSATRSGPVVITGDRRSHAH